MRRAVVAFAVTVAVLAAGVLFAGLYLARQGDEAKVLNEQAAKLYRDGEYAEGVRVAERALAMFERALGPDHPDVATFLNNLAGLYQAQGRYADAEPLYKRALAMREAALGPDHPDVARALSNLGLLYKKQGRYADAESLNKRSLTIYEKALGADHPDVALSLNNLAVLYVVQGRYAEAEALHKRSLSIRERALGSGHTDVGQSLNNLADLYRAQGRYGEAEPLYKRTISIFETSLGSDHPDVALALLNLAEVYRIQSRAEAEPLYKRSLAITERALGPNHPALGTVLNNLALYYQGQGRDAEAEPLYKRSLAIGEKALGPDHSEVATSLTNLAELYRERGGYAEAEPLYERALAIREKTLGPGHPDVGVILNGLALLQEAQGAVYNNLGRLGDARLRYDKAEQLFKRSLVIQEKALGPDHPDVGRMLDNLAALHFAQGDWVRAFEFWRRSTGIFVRFAGRTTAAMSKTSIGTRKRGLDPNTDRFRGLFKAAYRLGGAERGPGLAAEMFESAQWSQSSEAAASLAQMAARGATGDPQLAALARERQDAVAEWQKLDATRTAAMSQSTDRRDRRIEAANVARLADIDLRIDDIDKRFVKDFPDYAALANPKPLSVAEVQSQLRAGEALVLFLDTPVWKPTPEETFIWVVTKTDSRWVKSDMGTQTLQDRVAGLRCGLDPGEWQLSKENTRWLARHPACEAQQPGGFAINDALPFDAAKAYELYQGLFGGIEDLIKDKQLLLVTSGALTSLPFQVLVTEAPRDASYATASWLIRKHALTVLPSVASLAALRRDAKVSAAPEPFIGFGNPVLTGQRGCGEIAIPDKCPEEEMQVADAAANATRSATGVAAAPAFFRNGLADVSAVSKLCPLPDTAHELACVAKSLGAPSSSIVLGKDMTETALKKAPLNRYRVLHFATHGLLAGETGQFAKAHAEPALVMSPPEIATEEDDGLLTASEVAALKLDADWVVMSACNTAGGGQPGAEALSGLARAFFYAGARALLVSHWPVDSYAATMLTSRTFAEMRKQKDIGRSEAFRRAMLSLMTDEKRPWTAHPSVWAPFIVVGEGGTPAHVQSLVDEQPPTAGSSIAVPTASAPATPAAVVEPEKPAPARKKLKHKAAPDDNWLTNIFKQ
jgi:tetratricopeptide (TPR) repeat protein/CHAT domain-containing protein